MADGTEKEEPERKGSMPPRLLANERCAFCGQDQKACDGSLGAFLGPIEDGNRNNVFVHRFCALWSSEVMQHTEMLVACQFPEHD